VHATGTDTAAELAASLATFFGHAMRPTDRLLGEFERLELGITHYKALHVAADSEPTVKELAERLGLSLPGCSRAVDHLVRRGLMDRREDAVRALSDARRSALEAFARDIPPAQRERLLAALTPILEDLEKDR
jgi:DNA-binding MarR family transcriptional regulator